MTSSSAPARGASGQTTAAARAWTVQAAALRSSRRCSGSTRTRARARAAPASAWAEASPASP
eukprot:3759647-Alexandrium_andersonii.AAC.1